MSLVCDCGEDDVELYEYQGEMYFWCHSCERDEFVRGDDYETTEI
jgi:hypothetical protein